MDPTAAMDLLKDALNAGFRGTARSIALDLREWLNKGGFPPRGMTAEEARAKIEEAIRH